MHQVIALKSLDLGKILNPERHQNERIMKIEVLFMLFRDLLGFESHLMILKYVVKNIESNNLMYSHQNLSCHEVTV